MPRQTVTIEAPSLVTSAFGYTKITFVQGVKGKNRKATLYKNRHAIASRKVSLDYLDPTDHNFSFTNLALFIQGKINLNLNGTISTE